MQPHAHCIIKQTDFIQIKLLFYALIRITFLFFVIIVLFSFGLNAQKVNESTIYKDGNGVGEPYSICGEVFDAEHKKPLSYTNIFVLGSAVGVISNEHGGFCIEMKGLSDSDTMRFQYVGYKTLKVSVGQLKINSTVYLTEDILDLSEMVVFGDAPDARSVVKQVIDNKDKNYKRTTSQRQVFMRSRYSNTFKKLKMDYKKSDIAELQPEILEAIQKKMPRVSGSFTDFLGNVYTHKSLPDSSSIKIKPIRTVCLREDDNAELKRIEKTFNALFKSTAGDEYWKVKTGVLSQKIQFVHPDSTLRDSLKEDKWLIKHFNGSMRWRLKYTFLNDEDKWEFLYKTGRYDYNMLGGTHVNGEDVYVISFEPDGRGLYVGRLYISTQTYALIRADYRYAPLRNGTDFSIFSVAYNENQFEGSVSFEKMNDNYVLKYFSLRTGSMVSFDRNISLLKKRERFMFDKKEKELKLALNVIAQSEYSVEYLVLNESEISESLFNNVVQRKFMDVKYVSEFDDELWRGYSIIEPIKSMKAYRKQ